MTIFTPIRERADEASVKLAVKRGARSGAKKGRGSWNVSLISSP